MAPKHKARKVPRKSLRDVTNNIPNDLQTRIEVFQKMVHNPHSLYNQHLVRTSLTTPDTKNIRFLIDTFKGIIEDIDALNWRDEQLKTSFEEFSEGVAKLENLWKLCGSNKLSKEIVHRILFFLAPEPYDVLEPHATGPFAVAQVNKLWQHAALNSPHLWSRLLISNPKLLNKQCVFRVKETLSAQAECPSISTCHSPPSIIQSENPFGPKRSSSPHPPGRTMGRGKDSADADAYHGVVGSEGIRSQDAERPRAHHTACPGRRGTRMGYLRALVEGLRPRLRLTGFEPLSSLAEGQIVDKTVDALTVKEGALLRPFTLPNLRHVHIVRKDSPAGHICIQRPSPSEAQLSSDVGSLVRRSPKNTVTSISFTNPVLSTKLLVNLNKEFPGLKTLRIKIDGIYDVRFIKILTHLKKTDWLPSLETLSLWVQRSDDYRDRFFRDAFVDALKNRSKGNHGKFKCLQLYPDASKLMEKTVLIALKKLKKQGVDVTGLEEFL
ncbi:hypothetical protein CPB85DRAFT_1562597 [Mucidula mucida]|nr:hypothetical protein CPB85DRAFT_1562597 [Mucidula mucida]